ncbi:MAG: histidinol-phosphate transaminase [Lentisphaeria bacterium]|nr:histidinol-phosphate transaminase [Lentisphaeria bacterium]
MTKNYARKNIQAIAGYTPGEQLTGRRIIKLNTNENPYPPSPKVGEALRGFSWESLRLYPEPTALPLREAAADLFGIPKEYIICGNGSDDLLTIALRTFVNDGDAFAFPEPSYSLYPVLADLQSAVRRPFELTDDFGLPADIIRQAGDAKLLILARPNAPTGNSYPMDAIRALCRDFDGVVWIDEAYADFADDNCLALVQEFPNVVVSRTFSKSYSLAGLRMGIAFAAPALVNEMNKLKDSYNTDRLAQALAVAALQDPAHPEANVAKVRASRADVTAKLSAHGCTVLPSQANFLLFRPALRPAREIFQALRERGILVRYFSLPRVDQYIRLTVGTDEEMAEFLLALFELDR